MKYGYEPRRRAVASWCRERLFAERGPATTTELVCMLECPRCGNAVVGAIDVVKIETPRDGGFVSVSWYREATRVCCVSSVCKWKFAITRERQAAS